MVNYGPLAAEIDWRVWGTPGNFNRFRVLASLLQLRCSTESTKLCTMFGRLLGWYIIYTFSWALAPSRNFATCKIHLASNSLRSPIGSVTTALQQRASAKLCGMVKWNYGTSAHGATYIRLGGHHVGHRPTFLVWCPKDQVLMTCLGWAVDHCASISLTPVVCAVRTNDELCHCVRQHNMKLWLAIWHTAVSLYMSPMGLQYMANMRCCRMPTFRPTALSFTNLLISNPRVQQSTFRTLNIFVKYFIMHCIIPVVFLAPAFQGSGVITFPSFFWPTSQYRSQTWPVTHRPSMTVVLYQN